MTFKSGHVLENYFIKAIEHFLFVCKASKTLGFGKIIESHAYPMTQSRVCITLSSSLNLSCLEMKPLKQGESVQ